MEANVLYSKKPCKRLLAKCTTVFSGCQLFSIRSHCCTDFPPYYRQAGACNSLLKQRASVQMHIVGNCTVTHTVSLGILGVELRTKWEGFPFPGLVSGSLYTPCSSRKLTAWLRSASWRKIMRPIGKVSAYCFFSVLTNSLDFVLYCALTVVFFLKFPNFIYEFMRNFIAKIGDDYTTT